MYTAWKNEWQCSLPHGEIVNVHYVSRFMEFLFVRRTSPSLYSTRATSLLPPLPPYPLTSNQVSCLSTTHYVTSTCGYILYASVCMYQHSGTSLIWTPLGWEKDSRLVRCPDFRGCTVQKECVWDSQMCPVY